MRVVLNYLSALETAKTGIGHYTAELLRCLRQQAGFASIDTFPGPWSQNIQTAWMRVRRARTPAPNLAAARSADISSPSIRFRLRQRSPCHHRSRPLGARTRHYRLRLTYTNLRRARRIRDGCRE